MFLMKGNRNAALIAGLILSMTLAFSAPMAALGSDTAEGAGAGETGYSEDAQFSDLEGSSGEESEEEQVKTYTVTYSLNGHGDSWEEEVEEGSTAVDWADYPEDDGYTFTGWYTDSSCDKEWDTSSAISSDTKVYAGWEKIPEEEPEETEKEEESETESTEQSSGEDTGKSSVTESSEEDEKTSENSLSGSNDTSSAAKEASSSGDSSSVSSEAGNDADTSSSSTAAAASTGSTSSSSSSTSSQTASSSDSATSGTASTGSTDTAASGSTDTAAATTETATGKIKTQPQSVSVEYPAGAAFTVEATDTSTVKSYQWYLYDKSSKKSIKLDGSTAQTASLVIPSTTKNDNGRIYYCKLTFEDGSTVESGQAVLKITNKSESKPVLYVGNYAINPGETLFISGKDISTKNADSDSETVVIGGKTYYKYNSITFNSNKKLITFRNVHISNENAQYDHAYSPAVGVRLVVDKNTVEEYTIELIGENQIGIANLDSETDDDETALRFDFDNAKKTPNVVIEGEEDGVSLKTVSGTKAIVCDGDLEIATTVTVSPKKGDTITNGIKCDNLTVSTGGILTANAYGTCVNVSEKFSMESGSKAILQSITSKSPSKKAALYAGKEVELEGGALKVVSTAGSSTNVSTYSGIETGGDLNISEGSTLVVTSKTNGTVYGIKVSDAFSLEDSHMSVTSESSDGKGKVFGVLCGSSLITLAKEKVYTVQSVATDGIAFAALTGSSGSSARKYKESYTPARIKFDNSGVVVPSSYAISTGSFKNDSEYKYIETVYNKNSTTAPAETVRFDSENHVWGTPAYTWASDYKTCTATVTCTNYPAHVKTETATSSSSQTKAPTCTAKGQTTYTAAFTDSAFSTQTKTVENIAALGHTYGDWVVTTKPTLTSTGIKKRKCSVCGAIESQTIEKLEEGTYKIKKGSSLSWTKESGKSLEVKIERTTNNSTAFSHFQGILLDGKVLDKKYYTAKSGSVIIKFKSDFLSKVGVGTHTLTYGFEDGDNPSSKLVIKAASSSSSSSSSNKSTANTNTAKSAKTGDNTNILVWVLTLCAAGAAVVLIQRYKKNSKKKDAGSDSQK